MKNNIEQLEKEIGYSFKDKELLVTAITHSSYANEHKDQHSDYNERLEFLGDAVLELVSSETLFKRNRSMDEGDLTKLRASLVCEPTLAMYARKIHLGSYLRLGKGEEATGGRNRDSVTSDALEAVIGAIYIDGGLERASKFINKFILSKIEDKKRFSDSKTYLQEMIDAIDCKSEIVYEVIGESGPDHDKTYEVSVLVDGKAIGNGIGRTKKAAAQQAAYNAIKTIDKRK